MLNCLREIRAPYPRLYYFSKLMAMNGPGWRPLTGRILPLGSLQVVKSSAMSRIMSFVRRTSLEGLLVDMFNRPGVGAGPRTLFGQQPEVQRT